MLKLIEQNIIQTRFRLESNIKFLTRRRKPTNSTIRKWIFLERWTDQHDAGRDWATEQKAADYGTEEEDSERKFRVKK
jgi:hypothetical protein